eukprot:Protomagalhaensia_wolfi_Nauph_80__6141@NODE_894_length_1905_cov_129_463558_g673_i0_p3_GENE_NODE_894_length_1905_cov_129_463558_g673_i0NODE_894_length_1905_cov_129_463558_g673_i0_p3_ORF_typecomplete_len203_score41_70DUF3228/PF11539_8/1_4e63_NODE_894_length_1905_cov_129_463558_g673_i097705
MLSIAIADFALRRFDAPSDGPSKLDTKLRVPPEEFLAYVKESATAADLHDGYAPFCKHLFIPNKYPVMPTAMELSVSLRPYVKTGFQARTPEELPVLSRWVTRDDILEANLAEPAKFIDCIIYSHDQVVKEAEAMGQDSSQLEKVDWFIISLKFQNVNHETPMMPITAMRNSLIEEGGSGVKIDRDAYMKSVEFWETHVEVQ